MTKRYDFQIVGHEAFQEQLDEVANALAYHVQDLLDGLSSGKKFDLEEQQAEIRAIINSIIFEENEDEESENGPKE
jgi:hypothetical protein